MKNLQLALYLMVNFGTLSTMIKNKTRMSTFTNSIPYCNEKPSAFNKAKKEMIKKKES